MAQNVDGLKTDYTISMLIRASYLRIVVVVILVGVCPLTYLGYSISKEHDHKLYTAALAQCERVKRDRISNLSGWKIALQARERSVRLSKTKASKQLNEDAAAKYRVLVRDLQSRADVRCTQVVKKP